MSTPVQDKPIIVNLNRQALLLGLKLIGFLVVFRVFLWVLPYASHILTPLIISVLVAFLLNPVMKFLERKGLSRMVAVLTILGVLTILIVVLGCLLFPVVVNEVQSIAKGLENKTPIQMFERLKTFLESRIPYLSNPEISQRVMSKAEALFYGLLNKSIRSIPGIFSGIITFVLIPFMAFFFLKDGSRIKRSLIQMVPNRYFEMSLDLISKIEKQLGSYIRGQMLVSLVIGTLSVIALYILDVPYYFFIGVIAGLANMIPYFGPITGAVVAVIVNFIAKGTLAAVLSVVAAFVIIRLIDDTLVSPNILARSVEIHPLMVIVAIFIGGEMFGLLGLLLCIPVASIIKVTVKELMWGFKNYRLV